MPIRKVKGGKYLPSWRIQEFKARAAKRRDRPKRDILAIRTALNTLKLRYCQEVSFWNPYHQGNTGDLDGGLQWVDFIVRRRGKRPVAVIHDDPKKRWKRYEKLYHENKQKGLAERGVRVVILPARMTSQEYQILLLRDIIRKGE